MRTAGEPVPWIPILQYHHVVDERPGDDPLGLFITADDFRRQLTAFARRGYRTLSLDEVAELLARREPIPPGRFVVTLDDGYEDAFTVAVPVLRALGFTATVFVVSGLVGQMSSWDAGGYGPRPLMDEDHLRQLVRWGFSIGSHTVSHAYLPNQTAQVVWREVTVSRQTLQQMLRIPVRSFCYPYNAWSPLVRAAVARAGYDVACCEHVQYQDYTRYTLPRIKPAWPAPLLALVRSRRWYFELDRRGLLEPFRRGKRAVAGRLSRVSQAARRARSHTIGGSRADRHS